MCILLGIQAEVIMRVYYESQAKTTYLLSEVRQGTTIGQSAVSPQGKTTQTVSSGFRRRRKMLVGWVKPTGIRACLGGFHPPSPV